MSTATLRAYVPRPSSLPPSPAKLSSSTTNNHSNNPTSNVPPAAYSPRSKELSDDAKKSAALILELLSTLPAPLPATLGRTFNTSPSSAASSSTSSTSNITNTSFPSFSSFARKRPSDPSPIGLGLGFSPLGHSPKRARHSPPPQSSSTVTNGSSSGHSTALSPEARFHTPDLAKSLSSPTFVGNKKEVGRSSLRNEITRAGSGTPGGGKETWTRDQWNTHGLKMRARGTMLKRYGDAYQRTSTAKPHLVSTLPADNLMGLLCLTDSCLLFTYALWCDEQTDGRVRGSVVRDLDGLIAWTRRLWETELRKEGENRDMVKGMIGLMYLVEAVLAYTQSAQSLNYLHRRSKEITASSSSNQGPSPSSSSSSGGPSPPSTSHSDSLPPDIVPLISSSTTCSSRATAALLTSRHHLSIRLLRQSFPITWGRAIHSELADMSLPAPGDPLGAAKFIEIDQIGKFAWPIELGMQNPAAHVAVFGRSMVDEMAKQFGKKWDLHLGEEK